MGNIAEAWTFAEWTAAALCQSGYRADFTIDSLKEIDRFFDEQAPRGRPRRTGMLAEDTDARLFGIGAYVGETIRRAREGRWTGNDLDPLAKTDLAAKTGTGTTIWPIQKVMKRLKSRSDGLFAYGEAILLWHAEDGRK